MSSLCDNVTVTAIELSLCSQWVCGVDALVPIWQFSVASFCWGDCWGFFLSDYSVTLEG